MNSFNLEAFAKRQEEIERIAEERADWLLDAIATATQNRIFLRGEDQYDQVAGEAILANSKKAILVAFKKIMESLYD